MSPNPFESGQEKAFSGFVFSKEFIEGTDNPEMTGCFIKALNEEAKRKKVIFSNSEEVLKFLGEINLEKFRNQYRKTLSVNDTVMMLNAMDDILGNIEGEDIIMKDASGVDEQPIPEETEKETENKPESSEGKDSISTAWDELLSKLTTRKNEIIKEVQESENLSYSVGYYLMEDNFDQLEKSTQELINLSSAYPSREQRSEVRGALSEEISRCNNEIRSAYNTRKKEIRNKETNNKENPVGDPEVKKNVDSQIEKNNEENVNPIENKKNETPIVDSKETGSPIEIKDKKTENLKNELDLARGEYVRVFQRSKEKMTGLKQIFGRFMRQRTEDTPEVKDAYERYNKILNAYNEQELLAIRNELNLTAEDRDKRIEEFMVGAITQEKLSLINSRTKEVGFFSKIIQKYRNLNPATKIAVSVGLFSVGLGVVSRGISGVMTGSAVATGMEAIRRKKEKSEASSIARETIISSKDKKADELFDLAMERLRDENSRLDKFLNLEGRRSMERKMIGVAVGVVVGAGGLSLAFRHLAENFYGDIFHHSSGAVASGSEHISSPIKVSEKIQDILEVKKGSSIERVLINDLESHGRTAKEAGKEAHRMVLKYAAEHHLNPDSLNLVKPGLKLAVENGHINNIFPNEDIISTHHHAVKSAVEMTRGLKEHSVKLFQEFSGNNPSDFRAVRNLTMDQIKDQRPDLYSKISTNIETMTKNYGIKGPGKKKIITWIAEIAKKAKPL